MKTLSHQSSGSSGLAETQASPGSPNATWWGMVHEHKRRTGHNVVRENKASLRRKRHLKHHRTKGSGRRKRWPLCWDHVLLFTPRKHVALGSKGSLQVRILRWEISPDYPGGSNVITRVLIRRWQKGQSQRRKCAQEAEAERVRRSEHRGQRLLDWQMLRGATGQGMQAPPESGKGQETDSPQNLFADTLTLAQRD